MRISTPPFIALFEAIAAINMQCIHSALLLRPLTVSDSQSQTILPKCAYAVKVRCLWIYPLLSDAHFIRVC